MAAVVFLFATFFSMASCSNFSYPRMVILGPTGVGKSSLGNVLAGCEPNDDDCFFPVCSGGLSCTKETKIAEANYLGDGQNVTLVDTPGFGDSDEDQASLISEMVTTLQTTLGEANITILCLDYANRFDHGIQDMVLELEALFSRERFWQNVIIEVTKWAYDETSIDKREKQGYNETTALKDINNNLQQMFHLNFDLKGVFIDSFAVFYPEDELQQSYFDKYTEELWSFAQSKTAFSFQTIEDVLVAYQECKSENDFLNDVIDGRLDELDTDLTDVRIDLTRTTNLLKNFECPSPDDNLLGQEHCSLQNSSLLFQEQTESNIISLETKMNEEFVAFDGNLTEVSNHLVDVDGQFKEVGEHITTIDDQIGQMNRIIFDLKERLNKIETVTSKMCERAPNEDIAVSVDSIFYRGYFLLTSNTEAEFVCSSIINLTFEEYFKSICGVAKCVNGQWIMTSGLACCDGDDKICC